MLPLKAPFPYFGGKSRAAPLIWEALGDVPNYVEPFFGSWRVLLGRPHAATDRNRQRQGWHGVQFLAVPCSMIQTPLPTMPTGPATKTICMPGIAGLSRNADHSRHGSRVT